MATTPSFSADDAILTILKQSSQLTGASQGCGHHEGAMRAFRIWDATTQAGLELGRIAESERTTLEQISQEEAKSTKEQFRGANPPIPCTQVIGVIENMERSLGSADEN